MVTRVKANRKKTHPRTSGKQQRRRSRKCRGERPAIRFTPFAWSKLLFLRDCGSTEVSGFGINAKNDLLLIEDVRLVNQQCTSASVQFSDAAAQQLLEAATPDRMRDEQSGCIWIHTHPGDCALPSDADEETFARCLQSVHWAVMFIIAANGDTYARLQFNLGPGCSRRLQVDVDYSAEFRQTEFAAWHSEYTDNVEVIDPLQASLDRHGRLRRGFDPNFGHGLQDPHVRAAVSSEWLAHCDAESLYEDDLMAVPGPV